MPAQTSTFAGSALGSRSSYGRPRRGLAKVRWRIQHDHRELKDGLGLDQFEVRSYSGWHHHVTLVSVAHAFLTLERRRPPTRAAA
jgi:SRSO17 transposase